MLLTFENRIRGGICRAIHIYAKANNKHMKSYNKDMESSYLKYLDAINIHVWSMSLKLSLNGFEWVEELSQFKEDHIKNYCKDSNKGYFLEVDVEYRKKLFSLHSDLPFLPERDNIKRCNKLACNINDKKNYVVHIKALR